MSISLLKEAVFWYIYIYKNYVYIEDNYITKKSFIIFYSYYFIQPIIVLYIFSMEKWNVFQIIYKGRWTLQLCIVKKLINGTIWVITIF